MHCVSEYINCHLKSEVLCCQLCSTRYQQARIEKHLKSNCVIKVAMQYEKYGKFSVMKRNPSHATTQSILFLISKDEWNTKEDTGKSMKNVLYVLQYGKRHLSGRSDVKQWINQACSLSHCWVTRVWRYQGGWLAGWQAGRLAGRQAGRQAGQVGCRKFH